MKIVSIKKNSEFKLVYNKGKSFVGAYLVLYCLKRKKDERNFGITVSKKVGNAVTRNKVRRRIKEIIRLHSDWFPKGYDYVIVARVRASKTDYIALKKNLSYLIRQFKKKG